MESKVCSKCKFEKSVSEFRFVKKDHPRLFSYCIPCKKEDDRIRSKKYREENKTFSQVNKINNKDKIDILYSEENLNIYKQCCSCARNILKLYFRKVISEIDGFDIRCLPCRNAYEHKKYQKNRDLCLSRSKSSKQKNKENNKEKLIEQSKQYRLKNKQKIQEYNKEYRINNRDKGAAGTARYRSYKLKATPSWANLKEINDIYLKSVEISIKTGIKHSVDHIVPLQGKQVCGLHVQNNLRIIPLRDNISKNNKLIEELCTQEQDT